MRVVLLAGLLIICYCNSATAQTALRGRVTDAADGQPLAGAAVEVRRETVCTGTATDQGGLFLLPGLSPGRYALRVSFLGYAPFVDTLDVPADGHTVEIALRAVAEIAGEVVVEATPELRPEEGRLVRVRPADVRSIPALTPAPDLAAYLTTLPAFAPTGERGGQMSVRGGEPSQNLFLVDGIPIYQPFHVLGELSVVPGDAMAFADVYAGAFPARYGGRISSVVDVTLRGGDKQRFRADVAAAPLLSAVQVEGPLLPGRVSALVSARASLADRVGVGFDGEALPFAFGDALARVHAYLTQTASLGITALGSRDRADLRTALGAEGRAEWQSEGVGLRFSYLPVTYAVLAEIEVFFSRLDSRFDAAGQPARRSLVEESGGNFGFRYLLGANEIHFGIQARTDHLLAEGTNRVEEYLTEGALYLDGLFRAGRFRLYPGLRLSTFPSRSRALVEPRLRAEWKGDVHQWHAGAAVVHQEIGGRYTSNDLSDVFVAWVPVPVGAALPQARQYVAGWSAGGPGGLIALDAYYRALDDIGDAGQLRGFAQGIEARLQAARGPVDLRLGGAYATVRYREGGGASYPPPTDRPIRLDAQITGRHAGWTAAARWFFVSGAAFTPLRGAYREVPFAPGSDLTVPGVLVSSDGATGSRRLPATHRLDLSIRYARSVGGVRASVEMSVRNTFDRANLFYLNRLTGERYDGLPRAVALGLRLEI